MYVNAILIEFIRKESLQQNLWLAKMAVFFFFFRNNDSIEKKKIREDAKNQSNSEISEDSTNIEHEIIG